MLGGLFVQQSALEIPRALPPELRKALPAARSPNIHSRVTVMSQFWLCHKCLCVVCVQCLFLLCPSWHHLHGPWRHWQHNGLCRGGQHHRCYIQSHGVCNSKSIETTRTAWLQLTGGVNCIAVECSVESLPSSCCLRFRLFSKPCIISGPQQCHWPTC